MQVNVTQEQLIAVYASERLAYKLAAEDLANQLAAAQAELAELKASLKEGKTDE